MVSEYHWKSNDETPQQKCCHVEKSGRASLSSSNCSSLPSLYHEDNNMLKFKCLVEFWLKMLFRIFFLRSSKDDSRCCIALKPWNKNRTAD